MDHKSEDNIGQEADVRPREETIVTGTSGSGKATSSIAAEKIENIKIDNTYNFNLQVTPKTSENARFKFQKNDDQDDKSTKHTHCARNCPGKKKPCGANLTRNQNYCTQCRSPVDKNIFKTEKRICNCNAEIQEGSRFCSMCGQQVLEDKSSVMYTCSGKSSDGGVCDHSSPHHFDYCPKCRKANPRRMRGEISCPGEKHPCGERLTEENIYCPQCGWPVNKALFSSINKCTALGRDGTLCQAQFMGGDKFCATCGNSVPEETPKDLQNQNLTMSTTITYIGQISHLISRLNKNTNNTDVAYRSDSTFKSLLKTNGRDPGSSSSNSESSTLSEQGGASQIPEKLELHPELHAEHSIDNNMKAACCNGNLQLVKTIIAVSPNTVHNPTRDGYTPLMLACLGSQYDVVKLLLSHKVGVNVNNNRGETALILACRKSLLRDILVVGGKSDVVDLACLFAHNLHIKHKIPLNMKFASNIIELLISDGADVNAIEADGFSPLILSCIFGDLEITNALLSKAIKINNTGINGSTALAWACVFGHDNIVTRLLRAGSDMNLKPKSKITLLFLSSFFGRKKIADTLVSFGANINEASISQVTPLHIASLFGFLDVVKCLVSHDAHVDVAASGGSTPLIFAALCGQSDVVETLALHGGNVNHQDANGNTTLMMSVIFGHTDTVRLLLTKNAKVNICGANGRTGLMWACLVGWVDIGELLLSAGADVNATNAFGDSALFHACSNVQCELSKDDAEGSAGYSDDVMLLVAFFVYKSKPRFFENIVNHLKPNSDIVQRFLLGYTVLTDNTDLQISLQRALTRHQGHTSILGDDIERRHKMLKMLLSYRADINRANVAGDTPLMKACRNGYEWGVRILLEHKAEVNIYNKDGDTALLLASQMGYKHIVELLLDHKADVNLRGSGRDPPLTEASRQGHVTIVDLLLNHGADVNMRGVENISLIEASREGHMAVVELLLTKGADANVRGNDGNTPLIEASREGNVTAVEILVRHGAVVNKRGSEGTTSMIEASRGCHPAVVEALLSAGVDVNLTGRNGDTPLTEACRGGHGTVIRMLLKHGADITILNDEGETAITVAQKEGQDIAYQILQKPQADTITEAVSSVSQHPAHQTSILLSPPSADVDRNEERMIDESVDTRDVSFEENQRKRRHVSDSLENVSESKKKDIQRIIQLCLMHILKDMTVDIFANTYTLSIPILKLM